MRSGAYELATLFVYTVLVGKDISTVLVFLLSFASRVMLCCAVICCGVRSS